MGRITIAVAGQPNSGKSTLFNALTGVRQFVANYPGVTVEKRTGYWDFGEHKLLLVDLPGTYSLTSYSLEERIARDFLLYEKPDLILNVVDASNLERNLVLTFQLMEMGFPMVMALNMIDVAKSKGITISVQQLEQKLGFRVVATVANRSTGKRELAEALIETSQKGDGISSYEFDYGPLKAGIEHLTSLLGDRVSQEQAHWLAVRLMVGDEEVSKLLST